jgi:hypothetical protein
MRKTVMRCYRPNRVGRETYSAWDSAGYRLNENEGGAYRA